MAIDGLKIVGESINDSIPSTHKMFDEMNLAELRELAVFQDKKGAHYIDVNVGKRPPEFMAEMIRAVQAVTAKPLAVDSPDLLLARAGLEAFNPSAAQDSLPVLNSISALRTEMFDLYTLRPFRPVLLVSERMEEGKAAMNHTAEETYNTACELLAAATTHNIPVRDCIFDVGVAPLAIDSEGMTRRTVESVQKIAADPAFRGCSFILGLSNFTHMLPARRPSDNLAVKSGLESALLTRLIPLGFNMIIGSVKRDYRLLEPGHPALQCLDEILALDGFDVVIKIQEFLTT